MTTPVYTYHVGEKFHQDGSVRTYPGVTIICFAQPDQAIYQAGEALQSALHAKPYGHKFALLPPSSFHMTIFSLILDADRSAEYWSARIPADLPLNEVDDFFVRTVPLVPAPHKLRMVMTYLGGWGLSFRLSPADEPTYDALHAYRARIAEATGVRYPDHDTYEFHLSLAYKLIELNDDESADYAQFRAEWGERLRCEIGVFETGAPELTFFDDMFRFVRVSERNMLTTRSR